VARLRPLEPADLPRVAALMNRVSPGNGAALLRRWTWQVERNPWQAGHPIGDVVEEDGRLVGHGVQVAQPFRLGGDVVVGFLHMDVWLEPSLRGSLVGVQLYKRFLSRHKDAPCATTTANAGSADVWRTLRADPQPDSGVALLRPLRIVPLGLAAAEHQIRGGSRALPVDGRPGAVDARSVGSFTCGPATHDELAAAWAALAPRFPVSTDRSAAWFAWRFGPDAPPVRVVAVRDGGRVVAFYADRLVARGGVFAARVSTLVDVGFDPDRTDVADALIDDWLNRARADGAALAELKGGAAAIRAAFRRRGFRPRDGGNPGYWLRLPPAFAGLKDRAPDWHLTPGDGDAAVH
jgi:hypothetical protein